MHIHRNLAPIVGILIAFAAAQPANAQGKKQTKKTGPARWEKAIATFEKQDRKNPPPKNAVLFVGSSSIRMWNLPKSFPDLKTINRGFGGSQMADAVHFAPRIVVKHKPRIVVVYEGDNDLAHKKTPEQLLKDFQELVRIIHAALPGAKIIFIAVKPSLSRWALAGIQRKANGLVEKYCAGDKRLDYLDVFQPMLGKDGRPRAELFRDDGLHMNDAGYQLWSKLLRPHLRD